MVVDLEKFRIQTSQNLIFSYPGQENPTGSVVLDFFVLYCLFGTDFH